MAAAPAPLRERVSFRIGETQTITLDGPGMAQQGRDGSTEYRYMLAEHKIMWVPDQVHQDIERNVAGHFSNETLEITKRKNGPWLVVHVVNEPAPAPPAPRPAQPARAAGPLNPAQQQLPPFAGEQPYSASMYTALCAAIRTAAAAEKFSQEIGRPVAFDTSDIRCIAATLFINITGRSER